MDDPIVPRMSHSIKIALVSAEIESLTEMLELSGGETSKRWVLAALVGLVGLLKRLRRNKPVPGDRVVGDDEEFSAEEDEDESEEDQIDEAAEMSKVREWVQRLIVMEGEKGKGQRWVDLGESQ